MEFEKLGKEEQKKLNTRMTLGPEQSKELRQKELFSDEPEVQIHKEGSALIEQSLNAEEAVQAELQNDLLQENEAQEEAQQEINLNQVPVPVQRLDQEKEAEEAKNALLKKTVYDAAKKIIQALKKGAKTPDGKDIWQLLRMQGDDSASFMQMMDAAEKAKDLAWSVNVRKDASIEEVLQTITRLSECANGYYDLHRGHQYKTKGKERKEAASYIRSLTEAFYDTLDKALGGSGMTIKVNKELSGQVSVKEGVKSGEKMEELTKNYAKWAKHFGYEEGCESSAAAEKLRLFEAYENEIEVYKATHLEKDWPREVKRVIREYQYYKVQNRVHLKLGKAEDPLAVLARKHVLKAEGRKEEKKAPREKEKDRELTPKQLSGLKKIDQWLIRNYNNAGMAGRVAGVRNHDGELFSELLKKTDRERLFIYYLIENGAYKNPNAGDVFLSQSGYIPNLDAFKGTMLAHSLKILPRLFGGYVYTHKIMEAMQVSREYRDLIGECRSIEHDQPAENPGNDPVIERRNKLRDFCLKTQAYRDKMIESRDCEDKKEKERLAKEAQRLGAAAKESLQALIDADDALPKEAVAHTQYNKVQEGTDTGSLYATIGSAAAQNASLGVNMAATGVGMIPGVNVSWQLKGSALEKTDLYGGIITGNVFAGIGQILGCAYGLYHTVTNWNEMHAGDKAFGILSLFKSAGDTAITAMRTMEAGKQYSKVMEKAAETLNVSSKTLKIAGVASAGLGTALSAYTAVTGSMDMKNYNNAAKYLHARNVKKWQIRLKEMLKENKGQNAAEESSEQLKKIQEAQREEKRKQRFEKNILKLADSISGNKTKIAGLSTVTGIGGIVSLTVPVVGTVAGIPLMVAGFAGSFLGTKSVTTLREQMIDSYFRVDDFVAAATAQMEKEGRRIYDKDEFRVRIRRRLLAEAGFSGLIGASTHIAKKYAVYISEILFSENANRDKEEKKAYIQLVKSLGLKYSESKRKPEAYMIARKLSGR